MRIRSVVLCTILILTITGGACAQQRSDAEIDAELEKAIRAAGITLDVLKGVVTTTGTVRNLGQKLSILGMARRTIGVKEVVDRIAVVPAEKRTDEQIAKFVRSALANNLNKQELDAINIRVESGVVILTGTLPSSYPKHVAGVLSSWVPGAVDIRNEIVVRPAVTRTDSEIQADIRQRFRHNVFVPAEQINVSVANAVVTLAGVVDKLLQAEQAEAVARFTPGVIEVRNLLFVRTTGA